MPPTLSKSTFLRGTQCKKSLYLNYHRPELKDPRSPMQQAIFSQGHEVGRLAQKLFPGGIDAGIHVPDQYQRSISLTSQLISDGTEVIYEAGFSAEGLHCFVDILVKGENGWKAYEVKSSTGIKPVNLLDAAFQFYVMSRCGLEIKDISLVTLNTAYVRRGELDLHQLFRIEPVMEQVLRLQAKVEQDLPDLLFTLDARTEPDIDIGPHCSDPYDCDFHGHCWKHVPGYSVFDISYLSADRKWELYRQGIMKLEDIPKDFALKGNQWQQVVSEIKGESYINADAVRNFTGKLKYPLYFLDFESFQPAVPLFDHSHPYQQIVFQYSLHILLKEGSEPEHRSFLADPDGTDTRRPLIRQLISDLGDTGDIIVFNKSFEASILKEIINVFPEYYTPVKKIIARLKDLMVIFQRRHYYVPEMKGSYSIKQVLPALVPGFSYNNLAISDGGSASHSYMSLFNESDVEKINTTKNNLVDYCRMDTLAMVKILKVLLRTSAS